MRFLFDQDAPQDLSYSLRQLGHEVTFLREVLPVTTPDSLVFAYTKTNHLTLVTCNRDDFFPFAADTPHAGIIVVIRRRTRATERAALLQLLESAGEVGIFNNLNFA